MIKAKHSVHIERPVHEVFEYLRNHENRIYWQTNLVSHSKEAQLEKGMRLSEVRNVLGKRIEITGEVTEFIEDRRLTFKGAGPHVERLEYDYVLKPEDGGTRLDTEIDIKLPDILSVADPVIQKMTERELDTAHHHLKDILEHGGMEAVAEKLPTHHHHKEGSTTGR